MGAKLFGKMDSMCSDNTSYVVDSVINNLVIKIRILLNSFLITIAHGAVVTV